MRWTAFFIKVKSHLGNSKVVWLFLYFRLFTLPQKKTNSNCCTAALAVYLLLFSLPIICIDLGRLGHATRGACVLIWACWGLWQRLVATWAKFQNSLNHLVSGQCRKRLEACINTEASHSEYYLLWHCLPDIPVATITIGSIQSNRYQ